MAELIQRFESKKGRPAIYPWDDWSDGNARRLRQGSDFTATLYSFRTMVHRKARDLGMIAHTTINKADSSIEVWFEPKG